MHVSELCVGCKSSCSIWWFSVSAAVMLAEGSCMEHGCCRAGEQPLNQQRVRADLTFFRNHSRIAANPSLCPASDNDVQLYFNAKVWRKGTAFESSVSLDAESVVINHYLRGQRYEAASCAAAGNRELLRSSSSPSKSLLC